MKKVIIEFTADEGESFPVKDLQAALDGQKLALCLWSVYERIIKLQQSEVMSDAVAMDLRRIVDDEFDDLWAYFD